MFQSTKDFFSILAHLLSAYAALCTALLFKGKKDNLIQASRFALRQIFLLSGLAGLAQ